MRIAAITITLNDDYKFKEWVSHYQLYKDDVYLHIIVDNGSSPEYVKKLEQFFPESHIIKRNSNGGCTESYNDGIKYALEKNEIDAIMLIGNDLKLLNGGLSQLHAFLYSNIEYGMVAPVMLKKDSTIVEDFGCEISKTLKMLAYGVDMDINKVKIDSRISTSVTGGMNMASREFYNEVGLQDEDLFMYSDEVDMGLRAKKTRFKMAVTKKVLSWHQHINPPNSKGRYGFSTFLINRNKIYLGYKHFGIYRAFYIFLNQLFKLPLIILVNIKNEKSKHIIYYILGSFFGILKIKSNYKFIIENKI